MRQLSNYWRVPSFTGFPMSSDRDWEENPVKLGKAETWTAGKATETALAHVLTEFYRVFFFLHLLVWMERWPYYGVGYEEINLGTHDDNRRLPKPASHFVLFFFCSFKNRTKNFFFFFPFSFFHFVIDFTTSSFILRNSKKKEKKRDDLRWPFVF